MYTAKNLAQATPDVRVYITTAALVAFLWPDPDLRRMTWWGRLSRTARGIPEASQGPS